MQDAITLQLATLRDVDNIAAMSASLIEQGLPRTWTARRVSLHVRDRECSVVTVKSRHALLGFAIMHFGDTSAHLNLLAVVPQARRRGLAKRMLCWLHESAMTLGTFTISLEMRAGNAEARSFYLAMGYQITGYVPRYYSNIEDAVQMARDLTARSTF